MKVIDYKHIDKLEFLSESRTVKKFAVEHHIEYKCNEDFNTDEFVQLMVDCGFKVCKSLYYYIIDSVYIVKKFNGSMYVMMTIIKACNNIKNSFYLGTGISFSPAKYTNLLNSDSSGCIIQNISNVANSYGRKLYMYSTTFRCSNVSKFDKMVLDKLQNMLNNDNPAYVIICNGQYNQQEVSEFYDVNETVGKEYGIDIKINKCV